VFGTVGVIVGFGVVLPVPVVFVPPVVIGEVIIGT
jgi:hypothetical protein